MSDGVCQDCQQPPCDAPWLTFASTSATASKCGYAENAGFASTPIIIYKTTKVEYVISLVMHDRNLDEIEDLTVDGDTTSTYLTDPLTCAESCSGEGGFTATAVISYVPPSDGSTPTYDPPPGSYVSTRTLNADCSYSDTVSSGFNDGLQWASTFSGSDGSAVPATGATTRGFTKTFSDSTSGPGDNVHSINYTESLTYTISDPFTLEELEAKTAGLLPDYTPCPFSCAAYRDLTTDEYAYTIARIKWAIHHHPTGTCYLKVWLRSRFRPLGTSGGSDIINSNYHIYTWTSSSSPCLDPSSPYNVQEIAGDTGDEGEPSANGSTFIEVDRWSCIPGYDPATGGGTNGYPPDPV